MRFFWYGIIFTFSALLTFADTVTLKSGEKVKGTVLPTSSDLKIVMEVQVTPTIKDERVIPRSEVVSIEKRGPDTEAFDKIKDLRPGDTALSPDYYDEVIKRQIDPFLSDFAYSQFVPQVRELKAVFEAEKAKMIDSDQVKYAGQWISREDYLKNRAEMDSSVLLADMQAASLKNDYLLALNRYEQIRKNYPTSSNFPEAASLAKVNLDKLDKAIAVHLQQLDITESKREGQIAIASSTEQQQIRQAIAKEKETFAKAMDDAQKAGIRYVPLNTKHRETLLALQNAIQVGEKEIDALPLDAMKRSVQMARDAKKSMDAMDLTLAEASLEEAKKLWPDNGYAKGLDKLLAERKAQLEKSNASQKEAVDRAATPTPTP